jgi:sugar/nucleoside kinase (ribokinase family)
MCRIVNWGVTLLFDRFPDAGEGVQVKKLLAFPGGKGGNTAVAAARIPGSGNVRIIRMRSSDEVMPRQIKILLQEVIPGY